MFVSIDNLPLTEKMKDWIELEAIVYKPTSENMRKFNSLVSKFEDEEKNSIFCLINKATETTKMHFSNYAQMWKAIGEPKIKFQTTLFIQFLINTGIMKKEHVKYPVYNSSTEDPDDILYKPGTIEHALLRNDFDRVVYLTADIDIHETSVVFNYENYSLSSFAAMCCDTKSFKYLVMNGCDITNDVCKAAVMGGESEIIELCQQHGFDFSKHIETAIKFNRNDVFKWIVENMSEYKEPQINILHFCCDSFNTLAFMFYANNTTNYEQLDLFKWTPLLSAIHNGCIEETKFLLSKGADIRKKTFQGASSFSLCISKGYVKIAKLLIKECKKQGKTDDNVLSLAIEAKQRDLIEYILKDSFDLSGLSNKMIINLLKVIKPSREIEEHEDIEEIIKEIKASIDSAN